MDDIKRVDLVLSHINDYIVSIIDTTIDQYYNDIIHFVDPELRIFITKKRIHRILSGSKSVIAKLDPQIKQRIALEIRKVFDDVDDAYMRSVMHGKPDKELGALLTEMNVIQWNGI